jgi:hypothetical protein
MLNPARVIFEKITRYSRASAILAEPSCAEKKQKTHGRLSQSEPHVTLVAIPEKIALYNRYYERFADFKGAILEVLCEHQTVSFRTRASHDP